MGAHMATNLKGTFDVYLIAKELFVILKIFGIQSYRALPVKQN